MRGGRWPTISRRIPTPDVLVDALPDDATVCVVGWPDLIGEALLRRGDSTVLAIDTDDDGMGSAAFVRRLQRADVDAEIVPAAGLAAAVLASDLVVVEALAASETDMLARHRIPRTRLRRLLRRGSGVGRRRSRSLPARRRCSRRWDIGRPDAREPWEAPAEAVPLALDALDRRSRAVSCRGVRCLAEPECPMSHELLRSSTM